MKAGTYTDASVNAPSGVTSTRAPDGALMRLSVVHNQCESSVDARFNLPLSNLQRCHSERHSLLLPDRQMERT